MVQLHTAKASSLLAMTMISIAEMQAQATRQQRYQVSKKSGLCSMWYKDSQASVFEMRHKMYSKLILMFGPVGCDNKDTSSRMFPKICKRAYGLLLFYLTLSKMKVSTTEVQMRKGQQTLC